MKTKITLDFKSLTRVVAATALMVFASVAYGQQGYFQGGQTYWINGIGTDVVAPKDTFARLNSIPPYVHVPGNAFKDSTGIIDALNDLGIDQTTVGTVTFLFVPGYTGVENGTINIGRTTPTYAIGGGYPWMNPQRTVVLKPSSGNSYTITSSTPIASNSALVRLNGAQFVTIDGGANKDLTFSMAGSPLTLTRVIDIIPFANTGCQSITVKNCRIVGNSTAGASATINTFSGIYYGGSTATPSAPLRPAQNITITDNIVEACQNPIYVRGKEDQAGKQDLNLVVRGNVLGGTIRPVAGEVLPTTYIGGGVNAAGITLIAQKNAVVESNIIRNNLAGAANGGFRGITMIFSTSTLALDSNIRINANKIYNLVSTQANAGVYGIRMNLGTHTQSLAINITNNTIGKLLASSGGTTVGGLTYTAGILIEDNSANAGVNIYHNSVHLYGDTLNAGSFSACLATGGSLTGGVNVVNNIFTNRMGRSLYSTGATPISLVYAINSPTANPFTSNVNNAVFSNNTSGSFSFVGFVFGKYRQSIDQWKLVVPNATLSTSVMPPFVNVNDSTLTLSNGAASALGSMGVSVGVSTDINGNSRSTTNPSIGAYEFTGNATIANSALRGGKTYAINGVSAWPAGVAANGSFATLADAVTYLNTYGVDGAGTVVLEFASGYAGETTFIPQIIDFLGCDVTRPVVIRPSSGNSYTVSAPSFATINNQFALLNIIGSKYITIDGQSTTGQRNLTFRLPSTMTNNSIKVIAISSADSTPVTNITIRNCNIMGALATNGINTAAGIYHGHFNPTATFQSALIGFNNNMTLTNNHIGGVRTGIYLRGANILAGQNRNALINRNVIGGSEGRGSGLPFTTIGGAADQAGIYLKAIANSVVDSNIIRNTDDTLATSTGFRGIDMEGAGETNAVDSNLVISRNTIYNLATTTGTYCTGIRLNLGTTTGSRRIRIVNNAIAKIRGFGAAASASATNPSGILIDGTSADLGLEIYNNTVQMNGTSLSALSGNWSYCVFLGANITGAVKMQGNLLMNRLGRTAITAGNCYALYTATAASSTVGPFRLNAGGFINSNSYGADGVNTTNNFVVGTSSANYLYIKQWQAAIGQDFTSYSFNSSFSNDSTPVPDPVFAGPLFNGSSKVPDVNEDIKGAPRVAPVTCVGALQFTLEFLPLAGDQSYLINGVNNYPTPTGTAPFSFATISEAINYINSNGVDGISTDVKKVKLIITTGYAGEGDTLIPALKAYPRMNPFRIIVLTNSAGRSDTIRTGNNRPYAANGSVLRFNGGSNFEIDGSSDGATSTRNITIAFPTIASTNLGTNNLKLIDITPGEDIVSNVRIRNCNLIGNTNAGTINTYAALYIGGISATPSVPLFFGNNNMLFENNFIAGVRYGVYAQGGTSGPGQQDIGLVVRANRIGDPASGIANQYGGIANATAIYLNSQINAVIDSNVITNNVPTFAGSRAIELAATGTASIDSNISITRNTIRNIRNTTATGAAYGIVVNLGAKELSNVTIANNMISAITAPGTASATASFSLVNPFAIYVDATAVVNDLNMRIWNNSINMGPGTSLGTTNNAISACVAFGSNIRGGIALRNNILQNKLGRTSGTGSAYSILAGASSNIFTISDNNCYFAAASGATNGIAVFAATATPVRYNTLPEYTAFTVQDSMSLNFNTLFTNDTVLTLAGFSNYVSTWGSPIAAVTNDIEGQTRNLLNPTIGADELTFGGDLVDSIAPRIYNITKAPTNCSNGPFTVTYRVFETANTILTDTLYYSINGGPELFVVGASSVSNRFTRSFNLPAQPVNTSIGFRLAVRDQKFNRTVYPLSGYEYISSVFNQFPVTYGFDGPNINGWYVESQGPNGPGSPAAGGWQLNTFGSSLNPVLTAQTGAKAALFPSATLPLNTLSRLVSPCLDLTNMKVPTARIWVSRNGEALNQLDVVQVVVSAASSPNGRIWSAPLGSVVRPDPFLSFPGYTQLDVCLQNFPFNGVVVGIEGISKAGMNIVLDSIVIFDDVQNQVITPATKVICAYNELEVNLPTSSSLYTYTMFDAFAGTPLGDGFVGNANGGSLAVKAPNPSNPFIGRVDSVYAIIRYTNNLSGCSYQLPDTSKQFIRNFYGGPFDTKGTPFTAVFAAGTKLNPDGAKIGDVMQYSFVPPSGFTNTDYGTNWTILNTSVKTPLGNIPMSSAVFAGATPGGNATYTLNPALADVDSTFILSVTYRLLPSNCDSIITRYIKVTSAPATAFTNASDSVCLGASIYFTNTTTFLPNTAPITYLWEFGDGTIATTKDGNKTYAYDKAPGLYTVKLTAYNNAGVFSTVTKQIRVLGVPATSYSNSIACGTDSIQFTNNTTGAVSYLWTSRLNGVTQATSTLTAPKFNFPISDTLYAVTLRATDVLGCFKDSTAGVFSFAKPVASFTVTNHCLGVRATFNNSTTISSGVNGRVNTFGSEWDFGNGQTGLSNSPVYTFPANGTFTVKLKTTSNYGCTDSATKVVTVFDKPRAGFTAGIACQGAVVSLNNNTTYSGAPNKTVYNWNFGDFTPISTDFAPVKSYGVLGDYTIRLVAMDTVNNCTDTATRLVSVNERPLTLFGALNGGCVGSAINFANGSIPPVNQTLTYLWAFGDGATDTATNANHAYASANSGVKYAVSLTSTTNKGCSDTKVDSVLVEPSPIVTFTTDSVNCSTRGFTPSPLGLKEYVWNFGDGTISNSGSSRVTNQYQTKGKHIVTLTATSNNGCKGVKIDSSDNTKTWCTIGLNDLFVSKFNLSVYPNPFENAANIAYNLTSAQDVTVTVYDLVGRTVAQVKHTNQSAGNHTVVLDESAFNSTSAMFMVRIQIGEDVITKQLLRK